MGAAVIGGGLAAAGAIGGAIIGGNASKSAASTQAKGARDAAGVQMEMFNTTQKNLAPWIKGGASAFDMLRVLTGAAPGTNPLTAPLTAKFAPTMEQLMATPGYQFTLDQGQKAVQSGFAANGLASSGAALRGGIGYAEGLASTTYQQQFQNYWAQNQNIYNMLSGLSTTGANAAANLGSTSQAVGANVGNNITGAANASAAGIVGQANALTAGLSQIGNFGTQVASGMYGQPSSWFGGSGGANYVDTGSWSTPQGV